jgi:preprotein translocase subunit SecY
VTIGALVAWIALARTNFVGPEWAPLLAGAPDAASVLKAGLMPWIAAVVLLQLLAWSSTSVCGWVVSPEPERRHRLLRWMGVAALVVLVVSARGTAHRLAQTARVASHAARAHAAPAPPPGRTAAAHAATAPLPAAEHATATRAHAPAMDARLARVPAAPGAPDVLAALVLGSLAAGALVVLVQCCGVGHGLTVAWTFGIVAGLAAHLPGWGAMVRASPVTSVIAVACVCGAGWLLVLLAGVEYDLPADVNPGGRDAPPIRVPMLLAGVIPLMLADEGMRLIRAVLIGIAAEFGQLSAAAAWLSDVVDPARPHSPPVAFLLLGIKLVLIWNFTSWTFAVLYPPHRMERVFGMVRERLAESLDAFLDGLLVQNALLLCAVEVVRRMFSGTFDGLGLSSASFLVLVGGLSAIRCGLLARRAMEEAHGALAPAGAALGQFEAEIARSRLASAGIPSIAVGWTVQSVQPASVPGMGEMEILVPAGAVVDARAILGERSERSEPVIAA